MSDRVSQASLLASLATLRSYLADLERSSFEQHATKLRLLVNYFQKDGEVRVLAERLRLRLGDVLEAAQRPDPRLPDDPRDRLAFVWGVLFHLKVGHKLEVRELLSRAFPGSSLDAKWGELRKRWLAPFSEGLAALESAVRARGGEDFVDPDVVLREALESLGSAPSAAASPSPSSARGSLHEAVRRLDPGIRDDLTLEAEILALELRKRRREPARLAEIVATFERVSPELGSLARAEAGLA